MDSKLPPLTIRGKKIKVPIIQGGMGVGVSLRRLANAVATEGGVGIVSSAGLDRLMTKRKNRKYDTYEAVREEMDNTAPKSGEFTGINIMVALAKTYVDSVKAAIDAKTDFIISGAGLPLSLPGIQKAKDTALIPIVSSAKALDIICKKWERLGHRPDAVVLEGPKAGGHLGFRAEDIDKPEFQLETLLPPVKDVAKAHGDFPVIAAGGIYTHEDIVAIMQQGADGVQIGTRFLATEESDAIPEYKQAVLAAQEKDIMIAVSPGSPCGLPFRVLKASPMIVLGRAPKCDKGYVMTKDAAGQFTVCKAKDSNEQHFCICNGLLSSAGYNREEENPLFTVGTNAWRIKEILSVKRLMEELAYGALVPAV